MDLTLDDWYEMFDEFQFPIKEESSRVATMLRSKDSYFFTFKKSKVFECKFKKSLANLDGGKAFHYIIERIRDEVVLSAIKENREKDLDIDDTFKMHDISEVVDKKFATLLSSDYNGQKAITYRLNGVDTIYHTVKDGRIKKTALHRNGYYRLYPRRMLADYGCALAEGMIYTEICRHFKEVVSSKEKMESDVAYSKLIDLLKKSISRDYFSINVRSEPDCGMENLIQFIENITGKKYVEYSVMKSINATKLSEGKLLPFILAYDGTLQNSYLYTGLNVCYLIDVFMILLDIYQDDKRTEQYYATVKTTYATAFVTKKNITEKIQRAMKESLFNQYFGYIEFDDECDLSSIKRIEQEFLLLKPYLHFESLNDYKLRFRKLGKHRAVGLYFPSQKCLCVDVRNPYSFAHEYFHLLDYRNGLLSKNAQFLAIREKYTELLEKKMREDPAINDVLSAKSKYDFSYYTESTEIFARCGELYLNRYKKIENSLLKIDAVNESFAYPKDEFLMSLIVDYYQKLLNF